MNYRPALGFQIVMNLLDKSYNLEWENVIKEEDSTSPFLSCVVKIG
jgi:hypothetical protein